MVKFRANLNYFMVFAVFCGISAHTVSIVVLEKGSARFPCVTNLAEEQTKCVWKYINRNSGAETIFNGHITVKIEKFNVERSGGRCDLIIKQARITDAGVYACELLGTDRRNITALLTVLASNPTCSIKLNGTEVYSSSDILLEGDVIQMECSVVYQGDHIPVMHWDQLILENLMESINNGTVTRVTSTGILRLNSSHDGRSFECKTFFDFRSSFSNVSNPGHDHNFTCMLPPLNIAYGPSGMTVMPAKSIYHPGDEIKCHADSKPASKYEWINLDGGNVTLGAVFVVSGSMVRRRGYIFQCKATNEVGTGNIIMGAALNISLMVQHATSSTNFVITLSSTLTAVAVLGAIISCSILALYGRGAERTKSKTNPAHPNDQQGSETPPSSFSTKSYLDLNPNTVAMELDEYEEILTCQLEQP